MKYKPMWEFRQSANPDILELYIYGEVTDMEIDWVNMCYVESENSAQHFREELTAHPDVKQINVYINSMGGSLIEGTAIYTQLKRHPAYKTVYIDGFACSIAAVIAMAGDKVVMPRNTMMMIHNVWNIVAGNAKQLRKAADDLEVIYAGNRQAFLMKAGDKLSEEKLIQMLDEETWLTAQQCIELGLADEYAEKDADMASAKQMLQKLNQSIAQQIQFNKGMAALLREMVSPVQQAPAPQPPAPEPAQERAPAQNALLAFLSKPVQ